MLGFSRKHGVLNLGGGQLNRGTVWLPLAGFWAYNRFGVKKNRVLVWLVVGSVVVLGGVGYLAFANRAPSHKDQYEIAMLFLKSDYAGPTTFVVSPVDDPRTRFEEHPDGFTMHGVLKTDHPQLAVNTKSSPTGEIAFSIKVIVEKRYGGLVKHVRVDRFHFEQVK